MMLVFWCSAWAAPHERSLPFVGPTFGAVRQQAEALSPLPQFRRWLPRRLQATVLDETWEDARGSCTIRLHPHAEGAALYIRCTGVGSRHVTLGSLAALDDAYVREGLSKYVTTCVDMTQASRSCPSGVKRTIQFVRDHGAAFDYVAVVGRGLALHSVRIVVRVTGLKNVGVFATWDDAHAWLSSELDDPARTLKRRARADILDHITATVAPPPEPTPRPAFVADWPAQASSANKHQRARVLVDELL